MTFSLLIKQHYKEWFKQENVKLLGGEKSSEQALPISYLINRYAAYFIIWEVKHIQLMCILNFLTDSQTLNVYMKN